MMAKLTKQEAMDMIKRIEMTKSKAQNGQLTEQEKTKVIVNLANICVGSLKEYLESL